MPGAAPEPLHVSQVSCRGIWIVVSAPRGRLLERDLEVVAQIGAALRAAAPAAAAEQIAEAEHVAEDVAEDVAELGEHATDRSRRRRRPPTDAGMAEAVVQAALLGVGEDRVRFGALP